jgi:2-iminobutanoate/2-iminopropanoate deaminase
MQVRRLWPPDVYKLFGDPNAKVPACAQVVEVTRSRPGRSVHVAGTLPYDLDGNVVEPSDMASQARAVFENIRRSLALVGATAADVVRVKTYVTDMDAFKAEGLPVFTKFWGDTVPVSTAVQISRLGNPRSLIEVEVYAELD